ncbi:MAG: hypothetical protein ACOCXQ_04035 [Patescibacteria group bacterium]
MNRYRLTSARAYARVWEQYNLIVQRQAVRSNALTTEDCPFEALWSDLAILLDLLEFPEKDEYSKERQGWPWIDLFNEVNRLAEQLRLQFPSTVDLVVYYTVSNWSNNDLYDVTCNVAAVGNYKGVHTTVGVGPVDLHFSNLLRCWGYHVKSISFEESHDVAEVLDHAAKSNADLRYAREEEELTRLLRQQHLRYHLLVLVLLVLAVFDFSLFWLILGCLIALLKALLVSSTVRMPPRRYAELLEQERSALQDAYDGLSHTAMRILAGIEG